MAGECGWRAEGEDEGGEGGLAQRLLFGRAGRGREGRREGGRGGAVEGSSEGVGSHVDDLDAGAIVREGGREGGKEGRKGGSFEFID